MNGIQIFAIILFVLSALPSLFCIIKMNSVKRFKEKAIITIATLTKVEKHRGYRSTYYILNLQYKTVDNEVLFLGRQVSSKKHIEGHTIPLMYLADNPATFKIDFGKWLNWLLAFTILFCALIGWFCYWLLHLDYTVNSAQEYNLLNAYFTNA